MGNQICLSCGDTFSGRVDKKFCSDGCRNTYNNSLNRDSSNLMKNINNRLRKNYRILVELNTLGKTKVTRNKLISKGFDFHYLTEILQTQKGHAYYFVYDQGYLKLEDDWFMLVKKDF